MNDSVGWRMGCLTRDYHFRCRRMDEWSMAVIDRARARIVGGGVLCRDDLAACEGTQSVVRLIAYP